VSHRNLVAPLALCAALLGPACSMRESREPSAAGKPETPSLVSSAAPVTNSTLQQLTVASRDCLQYPIETRADGTEIWNADYFYFSLVDPKTNQPYAGNDGKQVGQALLASQAIAFMEAHPELESKTEWASQLGRQVQEVKDGHVKLLPTVEWVQDYDMKDLLAKDAAARKLNTAAQK
jgi:hypothetical protein